MSLELPTEITDAREGEEFREHPDWPHLLISTEGRVWSRKSDRYVGRIAGNSRTHGGAKNGTGKARPGAYAVTLSKAATPQDGYVHVLVLETFVGPRPAECDADHINRNKHDNRLVNLRWRPISENRADKG